jgi:hypothetical protein
MIRKQTPGDENADFERAITEADRSQRHDNVEQFRVTVAKEPVCPGRATDSLGWLGGGIYHRYLSLKSR